VLRLHYMYNHFIHLFFFLCFFFFYFQVRPPCHPMLEGLVLWLVLVLCVMHGRLPKNSHR
jgi:hypothetical protein